MNFAHCEESNMERKRIYSATAVNAPCAPLARVPWVLGATLGLLLISTTPGLAAEPVHHHYEVIDIGTFGGPQSYFDDLNLTDAFGFNTVFYNFALVRNGKGVFVGFADTSTPDPNSGNPLFCYVPDCYVTHAYTWQNGWKTDLGVLPGGASSAAFWINSNGLIAGNSQNGETDPVISGLPEVRAVI
jgi:hypothetical protein